MSTSTLTRVRASVAIFITAFVFVACSFGFSAGIAAAAVNTNGVVSLTFDDGWLSQYQNALPLLDAKNFKATFYIYTNAIAQGFIGNMSTNQIQALFNDGQEIGDHTMSHADLGTLSAAQQQSEIQGAKQYLENLLGSSTVKTFAYPYGNYGGSPTSAIVQQVKNAGLIGARSTDTGPTENDAIFNTSSSDLYTLGIGHVANTVSTSTVHGWIDQALATHTWVILMFHEIVPNSTVAPTDCQGGTSPGTADVECTSVAVFQDIVNYLAQKQACVLTVAQAIEGAPCSTATTTPPIDTTAPTITFPASPMNIVATSSSSTGAVATFTVSATDANPANPTVTCSPASGTTFVLGNTTVTCTASDAANNHATSTFVVNVTAAAPVNAAPVAANQSVSTTKNLAKTITLTATDIDSSTLTFATTSSPAHGTLSGSGASFTYTPVANYVGSDLFTFSANDGTSSSNTGTVSITVNDTATSSPGPTPGPNHTLTTNPQDITTAKNTSVSITLTGFDSDNNMLIFATTTNPAHGAVTGSGAHLSYTPAANYVGSDSFDFRVSNGMSTTLPTTISITVNDPGASNNSGNTSGGSSSGGGGGGGITGSGPLSIGYVNTNPTGGSVLGTSTMSIVPFIFSKTLQFGSRGNEVAELHRLLIALGLLHIARPTGYFGSLTATAVKAYQKQHGIEQVGIVGPKTRGFLNKK